MGNIQQCGICGKKIGVLTSKYIINNKTECVCADCFKSRVLNDRSVWVTPKFLKNLTLDTIINNPQSIGNEKVNLDNTEKNKIICPNCHSTNIQFMQQDKKAFSVGKATAGTVLTGGVGALAGFAGKKVISNGFAKIVTVLLKQKNKKSHPSLATMGVALSDKLKRTLFESFLYTLL